MDGLVGARGRPVFSVLFPSLFLLSCLCAVVVVVVVRILRIFPGYETVYVRWPGLRVLLLKLADSFSFKCVSVFLVRTAVQLSDCSVTGSRRWLVTWCPNFCTIGWYRCPIRGCQSRFACACVRRCERGYIGSIGVHGPCGQTQACAGRVLRWGACAIECDYSAYAMCADIRAIVYVTMA